MNFKNKFVTLAALGFAGPFVLFSIARTKLGWYINPIYPPLAILGAWLTYRFWKDPAGRPAGKWILAILLVVALLRSEREIQKRILGPEQKPSQVLLEKFKGTNYPLHSDIYSQIWGQADQFEAELVCGLNPLVTPDIHNCLGKNGFLMLPKGAKNQANVDFVAENDLAIVVQNDSWMIVKL
jgi:hypothetical protein